MFGFGAGDVFLIPPGANPTPIRVGTLQEVSLDISFDTKELYGGRQFPEAIARGKGKITGKAKAGQWQGALIQSILTGSTSAAGYRYAVIDESTGTIAGATYTAATVTGFSNLQVKDETGAVMQCVATGPVAGQYSVTSAGVYTFHTSATGKVYKVSYSVTSSATGAKTLTYNNQLMGSGTTYQLELYNTNPDGSKFGIRLMAVVFPKLSFAMKTDDFITPDLDFQAFSNTSGNVLEGLTSAD